MVKKGQGALEFLMTYGWAFLVILIMIGALAYFGILDPTRFLPDRCDFGTSVLCKKDQFIVNNLDINTIKATVVNNMGTNVQTYNWSITTDVPTLDCQTICFDDTGNSDCSDAGDFIINKSNAVATIWRQGESRNLQVDCTGAINMVEGDKNKFILRFKWYASTAGPGFTKDGSGEIYSSVQ